jgi:hypothetical protein
LTLTTRSTVVTRTEHGQYRSDAARRAERPGPVHAVQLADRLAAGADLGEQAWLPWGVDHVLGTEVAGAGRGRVVPVPRGGGTALEVLLQRVTVTVGEGLADDPAADRLAVGHRPLRLAAQAGQLRHRGDQKRVRHAAHDGEDEQRTQGCDVLANPGWEAHHEIPGTNWMTRSMSLMPMNGAMIPPTP